VFWMWPHESEKIGNFCYKTFFEIYELALGTVLQQFAKTTIHLMTTGLNHYQLGNCDIGILKFWFHFQIWIIQERNLFLKNKICDRNKTEIAHWRSERHWMNFYNITDTYFRPIRKVQRKWSGVNEYITRFFSWSTGCVFTKRLKNDFFLYF